MLKAENSPWLGLASYESSDSYRFFGRDREIESISASIEDNYFTVFYGKSGTGKSSLIRAGLFPLLKKHNFIPVTGKLDHSSKVSYEMQIISFVKNALSDSGCEEERLENLGEFPDDSSSLWAYLHGTTFWNQENYKVIPVLFIDQFEEIFTIGKDKNSIKKFFTSISELTRSTPPEYIENWLDEREIRLNFDEKPPFRLVFSLREDFLARFEDYSRNIPALRRSRVGLLPMNGMQALEVIMKPSEELVTEEVARAILSKVTGEPISKVHEGYLEDLQVETCILSLFCRELYLKAVEQNKDMIDAELLEQFGENIIEDFYKRAMSSISRRSARYLEEHLLTANGFRNTVALEDIIPDEVSLEEINKLSDIRLIRIVNTNNVPRAEFTHDVLCKAVSEKRQRHGTRRQRRKTWFKAIVTALEVAIVYFLLFGATTGLFGDSVNPISKVGICTFCGALLLQFLIKTAVFSNRRSVTIQLLNFIPLFTLFIVYLENDEWMGDIVGEVSLVYVLSCFVYAIADARKRRTRTQTSYLKALFVPDQNDRYRTVLIHSIPLWGISFPTLLFAHYQPGDYTSLAASSLLLPALWYFVLCWNSAMKEKKIVVSLGIAELSVMSFVASQYTTYRILSFIALGVSLLTFLYIAQKLYGLSIKKMKGKIPVKLAIYFSIFIFSIILSYSVPVSVIGYSPLALKGNAKVFGRTMTIKYHTRYPRETRFFDNYISGNAGAVDIFSNTNSISEQAHSNVLLSYKGKTPIDLKKTTNMYVVRDKYGNKGVFDGDGLVLPTIFKSVSCFTTVDFAPSDIIFRCKEYGDRTTRLVRASDYMLTGYHSERYARFFAMLTVILDDKRDLPNPTDVEEIQKLKSIIDDLTDLQLTLMPKLEQYKKADKSNEINLDAALESLLRDRGYLLDNEKVDIKQIQMRIASQAEAYQKELRHKETRLTENQKLPSGVSEILFNPRDIIAMAKYFNSINYGSLQNEMLYRAFLYAVGQQAVREFNDENGYSTSSTDYYNFSNFTKGHGVDYDYYLPMYQALLEEKLPQYQYAFLISNTSLLYNKDASPDNICAWVMSDYEKHGNLIMKALQHDSFAERLLPAAINTNFGDTFKAWMEREDVVISNTSKAYYYVLLGDSKMARQYSEKAIDESIDEQQKYLNLTNLVNSYLLSNDFDNLYQLVEGKLDSMTSNMMTFRDCLLKDFRLMNRSGLLKSINREAYYSLLNKTLMDDTRPDINSILSDNTTGMELYYALKLEERGILAYKSFEGFYFSDMEGKLLFDEPRENFVEVASELCNLPLR